MLSISYLIYHLYWFLIFRLQIQILGYNTDIYGNLTQATYSSYGLVMVAVLVQVSDNYQSTFPVVN